MNTYEVALRMKTFFFCIEEEEWWWWGGVY